MAKIPIAEVKTAWHADLSTIPVLQAVNLHVAWPGHELLYAPDRLGSPKAAVWFGPSRATYERHSLRADRQRRIVTCTFNVCIEVIVEGELADGGNAALIAESYAYDLWQPIDEHVADDKHLSSPTLVNFAVVDGESVDAGFTDTGYGFRLFMPIIVNFRLL